MGPEEEKLEVYVDGKLTPHIGRENLMGGAIRASFPEQTRGLLDALVLGAKSVKIRIIRGRYNDPHMAYYADD